MKNYLFLVVLVLFSFFVVNVRAQNRYDESLSPSDMENGVYFQNGPGNNNIYNWLYKYGTKLTVNSGTHRNFEIMVTSYPNGLFKLRQYNPANSIWTNWRTILTENENGNVGIGTTTPDSKLSVNGTIHTKEVLVDLIGWSDFVFEDTYVLPSLEEVEQHIKEKGHLKDIPSAQEVEENGILLGEINAKLLQKIEELTLYTIEQEKQLENQNEKLDKQDQEIIEIKKQLLQLINTK